MKNRLTIVHVDDNRDDRALVARELKREFGEFDFDEVGNPVDWGKALDRDDIDLIITDFDIKWTDGLHILRTSKLRHPECPVVMFTGTGSEEVAVEAMKSGLSDYVLKSPRHYVRLAAAVRSVLEKREAERKVARLQSELQELLNRLNVGVFRAGWDGRMQEANPAFLRLLGLHSWNEIQTINLHQLCLKTEDQQRITQRLLERGNLYEFEVEWKKADGTAVWVSLTETVTPRPGGQRLVEGLVEDITERMNLETQLRQAQKMESVGQLAAGVAHDFNNILTIIQGYTSLMAGPLENQPQQREALRQISNATDRAINLTRQLLTFSRKQLIQLRVLDLNEVVNNMARMLRRVLGEETQLQFHCDQSIPPVLADSGMLEQILLNLSVNARDAMPHGGTLTIATSAVEIDESHQARYPEANPGRHLCLTVSDTGCGMNPDTMTHIFEPFFTTKEVGKGTGLGLATVYGIVKQHHGWIEVNSLPNRGTTFRIYFPCQPEAVLSMDPPQKIVPLSKGHETILVVEDDPALREMVKEILRDFGYRILEAGSGVEAMEVWKVESDNIDLVLTDSRMPEGMTGRDLAEKLLAQKPGLKILFSSGYSVDLLDNGPVLQPGINFLQKPYQPDILLQTVRACLEGDRAKDKSSSEA